MMAPARTQSYVNLAQPIGLIEEKVPLAYRLLEFWSIAHEVERVPSSSQPIMRRNVNDNR